MGHKHSKASAAPMDDVSIGDAIVEGKFHPPPVTFESATAHDIEAFKHTHKLTGSPEQNLKVIGDSLWDAKVDLDTASKSLHRVASETRPLKKAYVDAKAAFEKDKDDAVLELDMDTAKDAYVIACKKVKEINDTVTM